MVQEYKINHPLINQLNATHPIPFLLTIPYQVKIDLLKRKTSFDLFSTSKWNFFVVKQASNNSTHLTDLIYPILFL